LSGGILRSQTGFLQAEKGMKIPPVLGRKN